MPYHLVRLRPRRCARGVDLVCALLASLGLAAVFARPLPQTLLGIAGVLLLVTVGASCRVARRGVAAVDHRACVGSRLGCRTARLPGGARLFPRQPVFRTLLTLPRLSYACDPPAGCRTDACRLLPCERGLVSDPRLWC